MFDPIRVFISGPMTGYEDFNRPAFMEAEEKLSKAGFSVFNPAWMNFDSGWSNEGIMAIDLVALSHCNFIYQLEGWQKSKGTSAEWLAASAMGIKSINDEWLEWYIGAMEIYKQRWKNAADQMNKSELDMYRNNLARLQTAVQQKGGLNEKEIKKGEYKSARPEDRQECSQDGYEEKRCAQT